MGWVVTAHHKEGDVYRVVVAWADEIEVPTTGEDGKPATESQIVYSNVHDYLFAADDKRWKDKSDATVAKVQRKLIADALVEQAKLSEEKAPSAPALPGVGDPLEF